MRVWWNEALPSYNGASEKGRWCIQLLPGFVNGEDPLAFGFGYDGAVGVQGRTVASDRQRRGQATGEAAGATAARAILPDGDWIPMLKGPHVALSAFRSVPMVGENVPGFFVQMGVDEKVLPSGISVDGEQVRVDNDAFFNEERKKRPLVAVDLWLSVARASLRGEATITDPFAVDGVQVDYSVIFNTDAVDRLGERARVQQGTYVDPAVPSVQDRLSGFYEDAQEDKVPLLTAYFLGPPDAKLPVNRGWLPFFKYHLFWNLAHAPRNRRPPEKLPPLKLLVPPTLGGGLLLPISNQILSAINQKSDLVMNALTNSTNEGRFWTV